MADDKHQELQATIKVAVKKLAVYNNQYGVLVRASIADDPTAYSDPDIFDNLVLKAASQLVQYWVNEGNVDNRFQVDHAQVHGVPTYDPNTQRHHYTILVKFAA